MPFVYPLCSSSKGNSYYLGDETNGILIDAGISPRQLTLHLSAHGIPLSAIHAIFITHEHSDHVKGLLPIARTLNVPIYTARETAEYLINHERIPPKTTIYEIRSKEADIEGIHVQAFSTPHDCVHSLGYKVTFENGKTACICTDLGHMTDTIFDRLAGSNFVLLESNYDSSMLASGPYPYFLKQRIKSDHGHLSNDDCADTLAKLLHTGTRQFVLGHLSEKNNLPALALQTSKERLDKTGAVCSSDYLLMIACPQNASTVITL